MMQGVIQTLRLITRFVCARTSFSTNVWWSLFLLLQETLLQENLLPIPPRNLQRHPCPLGRQNYFNKDGWGSKNVYECRCDERLQTKTKKFTRLPYRLKGPGTGRGKKKKRKIGEKTEKRAFFSFFPNFFLTVCEEVFKNGGTGRRLTVGHTIDKELLSTINKILIDKLSIRSFCY